MEEFVIKERVCSIPTHRDYSVGECKVLIGKEKGTLHLSISHRKRNPTWEEIKFARYKLMPLKMHVAMFLPPPEEYVNIHQFCFHLWEMKKNELNGIQI
jgi:hypothetical protein